MSEHDGELTQETIRHYFDNPGSYVQRLAGPGGYRLILDTVRREILLETPNDSTFDDTGLLKNIRVDTGTGENTYLMTVEVGDLPEVSYSLAYAVYRGMAAEGRSFHAALDGAIAAFRAAIAKRQHLSPEQVAGLFGELIVVEHLMSVMGPGAALDCWLGPAGEEHDFGLPGVDLEIKTTLGEKRKHVISGLDQLKPTPGHELWLVSVQVTQAGGGAGESLDEKCVRLLDLAGDHRGQLVLGLQNAGWEVEDYGLYADRMTPRTTARAYFVGNAFPALTSDRLEGLIPRFHLIDDVRYRVDVSALPYGVPCNELSGFVEEPEDD